MRSPKAWRGRG
ncbi:hypothetical protein VCCP1040_3075, partial [Vibrio cholerae CP1040(13)]